jgi:threonine dehydratase
LRNIVYRRPNSAGSAITDAATLRVVAAPGGAAALAALLSGRYEPRLGEHVGVLLNGGNTVAVDFDR